MDGSMPLAALGAGNVARRAHRAPRPRRRRSLATLLRDSSIASLVTDWCDLDSWLPGQLIGVFVWGFSFTGAMRRCGYVGCCCDLGDRGLLYCFLASALLVLGLDSLWLTLWYGLLVDIRPPGVSPMPSEAGNMSHLCGQLAQICSLDTRAAADCLGCLGTCMVRGIGGIGNCWARCGAV